MNFCWSTLYVEDLDESIKFYEDIIGLRVVNRFAAGLDKEIAFLGQGETKIELIYDKSKKSIDIGKDISWGFKVDSVNDMMAQLKNKNIDVISDIIMPNANSKFFFIKDPNGMTIQLYESISK